jgi:hypothetical protein
VRSMTRLLSKLLVTIGLLSGPAAADTLTWGFSEGGPITTFASSPGTPILVEGARLGSGFGFAQINSVLRQFPDGTTRFDSGFNDGFVPSQGSVIRLYSSWQGVTVTSNQLTLPTFYDMIEDRSGGFIVVMQVFLCGAGQVFCDNTSIAPGGQLVGAHALTGLGLFTDTYSAIAPGQPFTINEVFTFYSPCCTSFPLGDTGVGMGTRPIDPVSVPGPVMGAGLPGLLAGCAGLLGWWRRRRKIA